MAQKPRTKVVIFKDIEEEKLDLEQKSCSPEKYTWEVCKENIQPISQGRKIECLMEALPLINDRKARKQSHLLRKEKFDKDLASKSDDLSKQLDLWIEYIDWLEQNEPDGGKVNGITNAIETCIELYYDKKEFKQDKRLFNVFMKFKRFCDEPVEIFSFMYANSLCTLIARFYLNWSWHYEIRKNVKRAEDLIKLGLRNLATPRDVLLEAQTQLKYRIQRMINSGALDDCTVIHSDSSVSNNMRQTQEELSDRGIRAALQTLKFKAKSNQVPINRIGSAVDHTNVGGLKNLSKVVNGVRVAPKKVVSATNKTVKIFDENGEQAADSVAGLMSTKMPTSQKIQLVGRHGGENQRPKLGILSKTVVSRI